ncbi:MAG: tRNA (guanosine(46)-N7)-methyltransferase TrmB [Flavobacteriaceae bacterium]|nr:tRNA (guanosine(46)-N7)-methyltransferase TrmB [Flavobacteriaceae bacterium]
MGSKNKLIRFKENETFPHVLQPSREELIDCKFPLKYNWNSRFFKNNNPIIVEVGCGKGEYTVGLAKSNPNRNYIGIDIKGARFWKGAKIVENEKLDNVVFIRTQVELIDKVFGRNEVDEIWITFPDPQIKYKRTKHRLTNMTFLKKYKCILKKQGVVHLKTDSGFLHGYTIGILHALEDEIQYSNNDIYKQAGSPSEVTNIKTFYEKIYLDQGKPITYLKFKFK